MQALIGLVVLGALVWGAYSLSPLPACRAAATDLEDAKRLNFGAGPSWDAFDIVGCAEWPEAERERQIANIQRIKLLAEMVNLQIRRNGGI